MKNSVFLNLCFLSVLFSSCYKASPLRKNLVEQRNESALYSNLNRLSGSLSENADYVFEASMEGSFSVKEMKSSSFIQYENYRSGSEADSFYGYVNIDGKAVGYTKDGDGLELGYQVSESVYQESDRMEAPVFSSFSLPLLLEAEDESYEFKPSLEEDYKILVKLYSLCGLDFHSLYLSADAPIVKMTGKDNRIHIEALSGQGTIEMEFSSIGNSVVDTKVKALLDSGAKPMELDTYQKTISSYRNQDCIVDMTYLDPKTGPSTMRAYHNIHKNPNKAGYIYLEFPNLKKGNLLFEVKDGSTGFNNLNLAKVHIENGEVYRGYYHGKDYQVLLSEGLADKSQLDRKLQLEGLDYGFTGTMDVFNVFGDDLIYGKKEETSSIVSYTFTDLKTLTDLRKTFRNTSGMFSTITKAVIEVGKDALSGNNPKINLKLECLTNDLLEYQIRMEYSSFGNAEVASASRWMSVYGG